MKDKEIKWPPEGKPIYVSLRESNGERGIYECIYMGNWTFKFLQNGEQHACEIQGEAATGKLKIYLIGKQVISWYQPRRAIINMLEGDQNDEY